MLWAVGGEAPFSFVDTAGVSRRADTVGVAGAFVNRPFLLQIHKISYYFIEHHLVAASLMC